MADTHNRRIDKTIQPNVFVAIIGTYVPLSREQNSIRGYCPFCHNRAHSYQGFVVNPDKREWICEGCGQRGGISRFFEKLRRIPEDEAATFAEMLAADQDLHRPMSTALPKRRGFQSFFPNSLRSNDFTSPPADKSTDVGKPTPLQGRSRKVGETTAPTPPADISDSFQAGLLNLLDGRPGLLGVAIRRRQGKCFLNSKSLEFTEEFVDAINECMQPIAAQVQATLGPYQIRPGNTVAALMARSESRETKVVWTPLIRGDYAYDVILLMERHDPWTTYIRRLEHYCDTDSQGVSQSNSA